MTAAYEEGEYARSLGWSKDMNPYEKGTLGYEEWSDGYEEALSEMARRAHGFLKGLK